MKKITVIVLKKLYKKEMVTMVVESAASVGMSLSVAESVSGSVNLFAAD